MILFSIVFPAIAIMFGVGCILVAVRSWRGTGPWPSKSIFFVGVAVTRRPDFIDHCVLPFGLLFICLGGTLITAPFVDDSANNVFLNVFFGVLTEHFRSSLDRATG